MDSNQEDEQNNSKLIVKMLKSDLNLLIRIINLAKDYS
jgi:hypothetical protein